LVLATVTVPALGYDAVAGTLSAMFSAAGGSSGAGLIVLLVATVATLLISTVAGIPTSITLGLVGASAGAQIAHGSIDVDRVLRVLVLAAAGPVIAWALALAVTRALSTARGRALDRAIRVQQAGGFLLVAVAYGANDGQKLLAVLAVVFGMGVGPAGVDARVVGLVAVCFGLGTLIGLRRSVVGLRQGVLRSKPYQVSSTLWAGAAAVLLGAVFAAPVSMTQSVTGALIGSCPLRQWRRVRWERSRRIVLAWLWTLPVSGLVAWALSLAIAQLTR
jgi:PiT family inorganic phosphate transporter